MVGKTISHYKVIEKIGQGDAPQFVEVYPMKSNLWAAILLGLCLFFLSLPPVQAQNMLIQGGTLVDGTGKSPLQNADILVEGGIIRRVWSGDGVVQNLPPDTRVVDARGKFIIPGLIDSHVHYRDYMGELFLAFGVTTVFDLGNPIYWQTAAKKGLNEGKIRGPRFYFCGSVTLLRDGEDIRRGRPTVRSRSIVSIRGAEDAKQAVAALKEKTDCVKLNESMTEEIFVPIAREAFPDGET